MEAHPIPQNVTSFQFKLVGDMTLKQFVYLAIGAGVAYFIFVFFARDYPLIAMPAIIAFAASGAAFAFLPLQSRPLDYWLVAFLKAVYSPTKRVWKKNNQTFKDDPLFPGRLVQYFSGLQTETPRTDQPNQISSLPTEPNTIPSAQIPTVRPIEPLPTQQQLQKTVELARQAQQLQMKIIQTERTLSQLKDQAQKPTPIPVDYNQSVNKILADLQDLVNQASSVKGQLQSLQPTQKQTEVTLIPKEKVKVVLPTKSKQTAVALTTFPNVINGIVKDNQNNYLEGVVAVIYNKEGLPVRALKTNKLGQFTGSTPLPNGIYTLELEKDNFTFDVLQIELTGAVLPPLQIIAKG